MPNNDLSDENKKMAARLIADAYQLFTAFSERNPGHWQAYETAIMKQNNPKIAGNALVSYIISEYLETKPEFKNNSELQNNKELISHMIIMAIQSTTNNLKKIHLQVTPEHYANYEALIIKDNIYEEIGKHLDPNTFASFLSAMRDIKKAPKVASESKPIDLKQQLDEIYKENTDPKDQRDKLKAVLTDDKLVTDYIYARQLQAGENPFRKRKIFYHNAFSRLTENIKKEDFKKLLPGNINTLEGEVNKIIKNEYTPNAVEEMERNVLDSFIDKEPYRKDLLRDDEGIDNINHHLHDKLNFLDESLFKELAINLIKFNNNPSDYSTNCTKAARAISALFTTTKTPPDVTAGEISAAITEAIPGYKPNLNILQGLSSAITSLNSDAKDGNNLLQELNSKDAAVRKAAEEREARIQSVLNLRVKPDTVQTPVSVQERIKTYEAPSYSAPKPTTSAQEPISQEQQQKISQTMMNLFNEMLKKHFKDPQPILDRVNITFDEHGAGHLILKPESNTSNQSSALARITERAAWVFNRQSFRKATADQLASELKYEVNSLAKTESQAIINRSEHFHKLDSALKGRLTYGINSLVGPEAVTTLIAKIPDHLADLQSLKQLAEEYKKLHSEGIHEFIPTDSTKTTLDTTHALTALKVHINHIKDSLKGNVKDLDIEIERKMQELNGLKVTDLLSNPQSIENLINSFVTLINQKNVLGNNIREFNDKAKEVTKTYPDFKVEIDFKSSSVKLDEAQKLASEINAAIQNIKFAETQLNDNKENSLAEIVGYTSALTTLYNNHPKGGKVEEIIKDYCTSRLSYRISSFITHLDSQKGEMTIDSQNFLALASFRTALNDSANTINPNDLSIEIEKLDEIITEIQSTVESRANFEREVQEFREKVATLSTTINEAKTALETIIKDPSGATHTNASIVANKANELANQLEALSSIHDGLKANPIYNEELNSEFESLNITFEEYEDKRKAFTSYVDGVKDITTLLEEIQKGQEQLNEMIINPEILSDNEKEKINKTLETFESKLKVIENKYGGSIDSSLDQINLALKSFSTNKDTIIALQPSLQAFNKFDQAYSEIIKSVDFTQLSKSIDALNDLHSNIDDLDLPLSIDDIDIKNNFDLQKKTRMDNSKTKLNEWKEMLGPLASFDKYSIALDQFNTYITANFQNPKIIGDDELNEKFEAIGTTNDPDAFMLLPTEFKGKLEEANKLHVRLSEINDNFSKLQPKMAKIIQFNDDFKTILSHPAKISTDQIDDFKKAYTGFAEIEKAYNELKSALGALALTGAPYPSTLAHYENIYSKIDKNLNIAVESIQAQVCIEMKDGLDEIAKNITDKMTLEGLAIIPDQYGNEYREECDKLAAKFHKQTQGMPENFLEAPRDFFLAVYKENNALITAKKDALIESLNTTILSITNKIRAQIDNMEKNPASADLNLPVNKADYDKAIAQVQSLQFSIRLPLDLNNNNELLKNAFIEHQRSAYLIGEVTSAEAKINSPETSLLNPQDFKALYAVASNPSSTTDIITMKPGELTKILKEAFEQKPELDTIKTFLANKGLKDPNADEANITLLANTILNRIKLLNAAPVYDKAKTQEIVNKIRAQALAIQKNAPKLYKEAGENFLKTNRSAANWAAEFQKQATLLNTGFLQQLNNEAINLRNQAIQLITDPIERNKIEAEIALECEPAITQGTALITQKMSEAQKYFTEVQIPVYRIDEIASSLKDFTPEDIANDFLKYCKEKNLDLSELPETTEEKADFILAIYQNIVDEDYIQPPPPPPIDPRLNTLLSDASAYLKHLAKEATDKITIDLLLKSIVENGSTDPFIKKIHKEYSDLAGTRLNECREAISSLDPPLTDLAAATAQFEIEFNIIIPIEGAVIDEKKDSQITAHLSTFLPDLAKRIIKAEFNIDLNEFDKGLVLPYRTEMSNFVAHLPASIQKDLKLAAALCQHTNATIPPAQLETYSSARDNKHDLLSYLNDETHKADFRLSTEEKGPFEAIRKSADINIIINSLAALITEPDGTIREHMYKVYLSDTLFGAHQKEAKEIKNFLATQLDLPATLTAQQQAALETLTLTIAKRINPLVKPKESITDELTTTFDTGPAILNFSNKLKGRLFSGSNVPDDKVDKLGSPHAVASAVTPATKKTCVCLDLQEVTDPNKPYTKEDRQFAGRATFAAFVQDCAKPPAKPSNPIMQLKGDWHIDILTEVIALCQATNRNFRFGDINIDMGPNKPAVSINLKSRNPHDTLDLIESRADLEEIKKIIAKPAFQLAKDLTETTKELGKATHNYKDQFEGLRINPSILARQTARTLVKSSPTPKFTSSATPTPFVEISTEPRTPKKTGGP